MENKIKIHFTTCRLQYTHIHGFIKNSNKKKMFFRVVFGGMEIHYSYFIYGLSFYDGDGQTNVDFSFSFSFVVFFLLLFCLFFCFM